MSLLYWEPKSTTTIDSLNAPSVCRGFNYGIAFIQAALSVLSKPGPPFPTLTRFRSQDAERLAEDRCHRLAPMLYYGQADTVQNMLTSKLIGCTDAEIELALETLREGGVVAIPTDTVYGLAACAMNQAAVARVFRIKNRKPCHPIPLLINDIADINLYSQGPPDVAWLLAERFWPGPLTLVLKKSPAVPDIVSGGGDTVALRVPNHQIPRGFALNLNAPITGTSANITGMIEATKAIDVINAFPDRTIDLIVDGGPTPGGGTSTVVDLSTNTPVILRSGIICDRNIKQICRIHQNDDIRKQ